MWVSEVPSGVAVAMGVSVWVSVRRLLGRHLHLLRLHRRRHHLHRRRNHLHRRRRHLHRRRRHRHQLWQCLAIRLLRRLRLRRRCHHIHPRRHHLHLHRHRLHRRRRHQHQLWQCLAIGWQSRMGAAGSLPSTLTMVGPWSAAIMSRPGRRPPGTPRARVNLQLLMEAGSL